MTRRDELAKGPSGGAEEIEFVKGQASLRVGAAEIREFPGEFPHDLCINRFVDAGTNLNVAGVEANLPRVRWRNDDITTDEFAPVHVVSKRGRQQACSKARKAT